jgi:hypothetical protein
MLQILTHNKIAVVLVGLAIAGLSWFALSQEGEPATLLTTESTVDAGGDAELVSTLIALRAVKLEGTIFSDPAFASLKDYSTQIVPEAIGRPNPFAPLNHSSQSVSTSTTTSRGAQIFAPPAGKKKPIVGAP